jgi:hypothetical protein
MAVTSVVVLSEVRAQSTTSLQRFWISESAGTYCMEGETYRIKIAGDKFKMTKLKTEMMPEMTFDDEINHGQISGVLSQTWNRPPLTYWTFEVPFFGSVENPDTLRLDMTMGS